MTEERPFSDYSYQQFLNEEKLMGSKCQKCGALYIPPRPICPKCYSSEMQWVEMKGKGKLAAFTCIAVGPPYMLKEGYDRKHPYISGVIVLEEIPGLLMIGDCFLSSSFLLEKVAISCVQPGC